WTVRELDGQIFIWNAPHGSAAGAPPAYEIPEVPGIADGRLVFRGRHYGGVVRMHLYEFAENSADFQHFAPLHGKLRIPGTKRDLPGLGIYLRATWHP